MGSVVVVVSEESSHVDVLGLLLLLLLGGLGGGGVSSSGGNGGTGSGGGSDVAQELINVGRLESLGEKGGPVGLDFVSGSLDDLSEFLSLGKSQLILLLTVISSPSSWSIRAA